MKVRDQQTSGRHSRKRVNTRIGFSHIRPLLPPALPLTSVHGSDLSTDGVSTVYFGGLSFFLQFSGSERRGLKNASVIQWDVENREDNDPTSPKRGFSVAPRYGLHLAPCLELPRCPLRETDTGSLEIFVRRLLSFLSFRSAGPPAFPIPSGTLLS